MTTNPILPSVNNSTDGDTITATITSANDVSRMITTMWGNDAEAILQSSRLLHVTAVHVPLSSSSSSPKGLTKDSDIMSTIAISSHSPKSTIDFFILNMARALADADIVTGGILRCEPRLTCNVLGHYAPALLKWRYEGK
jgi:hypothetical protein